jgi:ABC-type lipopolysaccharide export system ATPase subunit
VSLSGGNKRKLSLAMALVGGPQAGGYDRPLLSSTYAVLVIEPFCVQFVTSFYPSILLHVTETTQRVLHKVLTFS